MKVSSEWFQVSNGHKKNMCKYVQDLEGRREAAKKLLSKSLVMAQSVTVTHYTVTDPLAHLTNMKQREGPQFLQAWINFPHENRCKNP